MQFTDAVAVSGTRRTADGYLVAEAKAVRKGIQLYLGDEVGKPEMRVVRVYRPEEEVFSDASLQSFTHAPVTDDHPKDAVTSENWKDLAVGEVSTAAKKDGEWVWLPLILKDAKAISKVEGDKRELSAGYTCELVWGDGVTPSGEAYDASRPTSRSTTWRSSIALGLVHKLASETVRYPGAPPRFQPPTRRQST